MMLQDGLIADAHGQGDRIAMKGVHKEGARGLRASSSLCLSPAEMHGHVCCRASPTMTRADGDWLLRVAVYRMPIPYCYRKQISVLKISEPSRSFSKL